MAFGTLAGHSTSFLCSGDKNISLSTEHRSKKVSVHVTSFFSVIYTSTTVYGQWPKITTHKKTEATNNCSLCDILSVLSERFSPVTCNSPLLNYVLIIFKSIIAIHRLVWYCKLIKILIIVTCLPVMETREARIPFIM